MFTIDPKTTKIDLERTGNDVLVKMWFGKWKEGSAAAIYDYQPGASIDRLLAECEKQGFTVEMMDNHHGRALRGEITRVDIVQSDKKWAVRKYCYGWTARTRPISQREMTDAEAAKAIAWCKEHGWTVREFPGGARAWKGEVKPVRDASTIRMLRRQVMETLRREGADQRLFFDLAYDF
jgi:hypothetical protein